MSYTPTTWTTGDTITATKLNKMENGIASAGGGGASGLVTETNDELDKTWNEINAMVLAGTIPFIKYSSGYIGRVVYLDDSDDYVVQFGIFDIENQVYTTNMYVSSTADGTLVLD